jgi:hypothetical protein
MRHYFRKSLTDCIGLRTATVVCGTSPNLSVHPSSFSGPLPEWRTPHALKKHDASLAYEVLIRLCIAVSLLRKRSTEWRSTTAFCLSSRSVRPPRQRVLCWLHIERHEHWP